MKNLLLILLSASVFSAHAGSKFEELRGKVRDVQQQVEAAYGATNRIDNQAMVTVIKAMGASMALLKEVAGTPVGNGGITQEQKGEIYQQILVGDEANNDYGSTAKLIWGSMTHAGFDAVHTSDGNVTMMKRFVRSFQEAFNDAKTIVTGRFLERMRREKLARHMTVRAFDMNEFLNSLDKDDNTYGYAATEIEKIATYANDVRTERRFAERAAIALYTVMIGVNAGIGPIPLPVPWQADWAYYVMGDTFGHSLISGATYIAMYATFLTGKYLFGTKKTYSMVKDLTRIVADPMTGIVNPSEEGGEKATMTADQYEALAKQRGDEKHAFKEGILAGQGALGSHRQKMIHAGYDPQDPTKGCENLLAAPL